MRSLIKKIINITLNILVFLIGLFVRRNNKIIIIGSWMGERFADNSRYLFQYLSENKALFGIERIIWVTDNKEILQHLLAANYEVYLKKSIKGIYWHLKAGIHIVCNMYAHTGNYKGDIIGELSAGAIKIQLWHGVAIKACGKLTRSYQTTSYSLLGKIRILLSSRKFLGAALFTPGCWSKRYHLCTSNENARVAVEDYDVLKERIIISNYPRLNDEVVKLLEYEKETINKLNAKRHKFLNVILYCPTFREKQQSNSEYKNPLSSTEFLNFLEKNNLLWIEKRHAASTYSFERYLSENVFFVDSNFDINLLYRFIDLAVTDYSSAASDCVYRNIKILSFIPDYNDYRTQERGFVAPYSSYYPGDITTSIVELEKGIIAAFSKDYFNSQRTEKYCKCKEFLFEGHSNNLYDIVKSLLSNVLK